MKLFTAPKVVLSVIFLTVLLAFIDHLLTPFWVESISWIVLIYFTLEVACKIYLEGWRTYANSWGNRADLFIIAASLLWVLVHGMGEGSLAFLRMFRFLSMVRILKLMPDTAQMLRGVLRAIKASRAIVILLGIQLVFFSLLGFTLFGQPLPEFFGTPLKSLNTIFSVFTVENWAAAPEAASLLGQPWLYYGVNSFVILVLVIGGFISLSLANAIFVDEMASDNNDDVKAQLLLLKQDNQAMQTQLEEILFTLKSSKP